jgi:hypothetical protein
MAGPWRGLRFVSDLYGIRYWKGGGRRFEVTLLEQDPKRTYENTPIDKGTENRLKAAIFIREIASKQP